MSSSTTLCREASSFFSPAILYLNFSKTQLGPDRTQPNPAPLWVVPGPAQSEGRSEGREGDPRVTASGVPGLCAVKRRLDVQSYLWKDGRF